VLSVEPNPIPVRPFAFGHGVFGYAIDPEITVTETAGLGGHVELIRITARDRATREEVDRGSLGAAGIASRSDGGTNYVKGNGSLRLRLMFGSGFNFFALPNLVFSFEVRFLDDKGNVLTQTLEVPEALPRVECTPGVPGCPAQ
jgi:hypothetical protein